MVFVKHNSLTSDIFFTPIFIPGFSGSRFIRVQVFQGPGFSGSRFFRVRVQGPESGSRVRVQVLEVAVLFTFVFTLFRSSHRRCFIKKAVLKNFAIFTWKRTPVLGSLFNKVAGLQVLTLLKRNSNTGVFL